MKTSEIEKLCKDERRMILYKGNGCQWIAVNGVIMPMVANQALTERLCEIAELLREAATYEKN